MINRLQFQISRLNVAVFESKNTFHLLNINDLFRYHMVFVVEYERFCLKNVDAEYSIDAIQRAV